MKSCYQHYTLRAVTECEGCGRPLCGDCIESEEDGKAFCYDCALERQLSDFQDRGVVEAEEIASREEAAKGYSLGFKILASILSLLILAGAGFTIYYYLSRGGAAEASPEQEVVWNRDECMLTMQEIRTALDAYKADHGSFPGSLQQLGPEYLDIEAVCPLTGAPYEYEASGGGYTISCPNPGEHGAVKVTASEGSVPYFKPVYGEGGT
jgi:hypothetical protein